MAIAAPVGEAGQHRIGADVRLAAAAVFANAVALAERHQQAVALLELTGFLADLLDHATELMAHDEWHRRHQPDPGPIAGPCVPIGAANALGFGADDDAIRGTAWVLNVLDDQRFADRLHYCCFHRSISS